MSGSTHAQVLNLELARKRHFETRIYQQWLDHFHHQAHEKLLSALVHEHENDFPMRTSPEIEERLKHRALVDVLQQRAQSQFLKSFLSELDAVHSNA